MWDTIKSSWLRALGVLVLSLSLTACGDDSTGANGGGQTEISGVVTSDVAGKNGEEVDDAAVEGRPVNNDGSTREASGEARTNARGEYTLMTDAASEFILVTANKGSFSSQVLVDASASSRVQAVTMSSETRTEADVFMEARRQGGDRVSSGDVAAFVTAETAARVDAGAESANRIAAAIERAEEAEVKYAMEAGAMTSAQVEAAENREKAAYRAFQAETSGSLTVSAAAKNRLESSVANAAAEAGASAEAHAKARAAARDAMVRFTSNLESQTRFQLRKQAELMAAIATGSAIEAEFRSKGSSTRANSAASASVSLQAQIRTASTESEVRAAWNSYKTEIEGLVAAQIQLSQSLLSTALTSMTQVKASVDAQLASASSVDAVVTARATYYTSAESSLGSALSLSSDAMFGARVLALTGAH